MKVRVIAHVRRADKLFEVGAQAYCTRLRRLVPFERVELRGKEEVSLKQLQLVGPRRFCVVLDAGGWQPTSKAFREWLDSMRTTGLTDLNFVIGGPFGLPEGARSESDRVLSLSPLTLPHRLAQVLLLEQLYRAFATLSGQDYDH